MIELGNRFQIHFFAGKIHEDGVSGRHATFDEVLLTLVAYFVKLPKSPDLSRRDALLTVLPFGLLVISIRNAFLQEHRLGLENGESSSRGNHGCIKDVFFRQTSEQAMLFGHKAPRFFRPNPA